MSGHDLVREIIRKHGIDRYPTVELATMKVVEELGELCETLLKPTKTREDAAKEYGDVGLALHGLGNVLAFNLDQEMKKVVDNETRTFT